MGIKYIMPRRGKVEDSHKTTFTPYELFYITDLKIFGVANANGEPDLIAKVKEYPTVNDFPTTPEIGQFYLAIDSGELFIHDGADYKNVNMHVTYHPYYFTSGVKEQYRIRLR